MYTMLEKKKHWISLQSAKFCTIHRCVMVDLRFSWFVLVLTRSWIIMVTMATNGHQLECPWEPPEGTAHQTIVIPSQTTSPITHCLDSSAIITFTCLIILF